MKNKTIKLKDLYRSSRYRVKVSDHNLNALALTFIYKTYISHYASSVKDHRITDLKNTITDPLLVTILTFYI